ncbi:MAG: FixH family protein, partial [Gammaproteobacteria bacterium]|nr:FixH family protein [Gammaproteobacteria bacterium]
KATELKLNAVIKFNITDKVINIKFDKGLLDNYPNTLQLNFQHATHANSDVFVELNHGINDSYIGYLQQTLSEGIWYFEVSDDDWKLSARSYVRTDNVIRVESN